MNIFLLPVVFNHHAVLNTAVRCSDVEIPAKDVHLLSNRWHFVCGANAKYFETKKLGGRLFLSGNQILHRPCVFHVETIFYIVSTEGIPQTIHQRKNMYFLFGGKLSFYIIWLSLDALSV